MAQTDDGIQYGCAELMINSKKVGYIDENGLQPAGNSPQFMNVKAAQVLTGSIKSIQTDPGSTAFTFNLIQLTAQNLVDVIGGKAGEKGDWTPPATVFVDNVPVIIKFHSGHSWKIPNGKISRNGFPNGVNMSNVFAFGFRLDIQATEENPAGYQTFPPGIDPETGVEYIE